MIAETIYQNPSIEVISLCESPIQPEHVAVLYRALMEHPYMYRFMSKKMFHQPAASGQNWGLLMLADTRYKVTPVHCDSPPKLSNRFQLWQLTKTGVNKYVALAHFPFAGDESKTAKMALSILGHEYCALINKLMKQYSDECLFFCADFSLNPYLISQWTDRELDKIPHHNSMLLTQEGAATVTVDGILLSNREKQKYYSSRPKSDLFETLKSEYRFFKSLVTLTPKEHDKQVALVPHHPGYF